RGVGQFKGAPVNQFFFRKVFASDAWRVEGELIVDFIGCQRVLFEFGADPFEQRSEYERQRVQQIDRVFKFGLLTKLQTFIIWNKRIHLLSAGELLQYQSGRP